MKKALLIRWGAFGDLVMATPVIRVLKEDGYHVTVSVTDRSKMILNHNPHIDKFIIQKDGEVKGEDLKKHWEELSKGFDKVVNLSESIEGTLLKVPDRKDYFKTKDELEAECDVNYIDRGLEIAGYPEKKGLNPELYFSKLEEKLARDIKKKYRDKFVVLWSLSGSAFHKVYPYTEFVARAFLEKYKDAVIMTIGDAFCEMLEWSHERTKCYSNKWSIRKSMIMTKYVDLVVGTETGVMVAASCFDTPKVIMLSHASRENLTKYWENCEALNAAVECYPCHKLHYDLSTCQLDEKLKSPICMARLHTLEVFNAMEKFYLQSRNINLKEERYGSFCR